MSSSNRILYRETGIWTPQSLYRLCLGLFHISSKFADTQIKVPHAWNCVHTTGTKPVFSQTLLQHSTFQSFRCFDDFAKRGEKAISRATNVRFAHHACTRARFPWKPRAARSDIESRTDIARHTSALATEDEEEARILEML